MSFLILIAGLPATGKTSFAGYLSEKMKIPMCSKDLLKERLFDTVGFKNRNEKVALGIGAMEIMYHVAETHLAIGQPIILENNFENASKPGLVKLIEKYQCKTITVRFHTDINVLINRFVIRDKSPERHRGHVINTQYPEVKAPQSTLPESEPISPDQYYKTMTQRGMMEFSIGGKEIIVDTTDFRTVSYEKIYDEIMRILSE